MAHLLIVELPGGNDTDLLEAALERGDDFTFLSADLMHYQRQPVVRRYLERAWLQVEVAPFSEPEVIRRLREIHPTRAFDAVLCAIDIRIREAAAIAREFNLRFLNCASAALLRDKYNTRRRLSACHIAQPEFALATTNQELRAAVEEMGLPVLIKPVDGYGSQNIVTITSPHELDPLVMPLDQMLPSFADYGLGVIANDRLLVERFMSGTVMGCDTLTYGGRHYLLGIHEKQFFPAPSFAIRGSVFIAAKDGFLEIEQYLFNALDAVGFDWGAAHTEIMLTAEGPKVIEINPRLVGATISRLVSLGTGWSIPKTLIALHCGEAQAFIPGETTVTASRWLAATRPGKFSHVEFPPLTDFRIKRIECVKLAGDFVGPPYENIDRIGYVMTCAPTASEAVSCADDYIGKCKVILQDDLASPFPSMTRARPQTRV